MRKFRFFLDFAKEEKWLEEMAAKGWKLKEHRRSSHSYSFEAAPPENVNIKIDYRFFKNESDYNNYVALFEDSGWRYITGRKGSGTHYFVKKDENGSEDIFSDNRSRAGRLWRQLLIFLLSGVIIVPFTVIRIVYKGELGVSEYNGLLLSFLTVFYGIKTLILYKKALKKGEENEKI